jgi:hypothetical protein
MICCYVGFADVLSFNVQGDDHPLEDVEKIAIIPRKI